MWGESDFNSTFSSPGGNAGKDMKKTMIKYVVPVTCQAVHLCTPVEGESSTFEHNNVRFSQICLLGLIRNVIKRANDVTYLIDDMSSSELVSVKLQAEEPDDMESAAAEAKSPQHTFIENQYVKVFGIIKSLQGQKNVQAYKIYPVGQLNEIAHHMLECMNASIHYCAKASGENYGGDVATSFGGVNASARPAYGDQTGAASASFGGLSGLQLNLTNFIKSAKTSEGVELKEIINNFKGIPANKIREALEFLSNEGQVYTTIDDEHFKTTDS